MRRLFTSVCLCCCMAAYSQIIKVDLIVHHAVVYTVDSLFTKAEAIAIKEGKIIAVGTNKNILAAYSAPIKTDAKGSAVYPGFIDAHAHFVGYAQSLFTIDLFDVTSEAELVKRVQLFTASHPGIKWILGRGWDQNKFSNKAFPNNKELNRLYPSTPVLLTRIDGHAALANAKALELANIRRTSRLAAEKLKQKITGSRAFWLTMRLNWCHQKYLRHQQKIMKRHCWLRSTIALRKGLPPLPIAG